jgi:hypothetical protein
MQGIMMCLQVSDVHLSCAHVVLVVWAVWSDGYADVLFDLCWM